MADYTPHPHVKDRTEQGPVTTDQQHRRADRYSRANAWLAMKITGLVGSMSCAWIFALIALISLPAAVSSGNVIIIVSWIAQTFLQLVLLSIIIVGQNIQAAASD